eukprot:Partr_v1_DN26639_c2_g1_i1_m69264
MITAGELVERLSATNLNGKRSEEECLQGIVQVTAEIKCDPLNAKLLVDRASLYLECDRSAHALADIVRASENALLLRWPSDMLDSTRVQLNLLMIGVTSSIDCGWLDYAENLASRYVGLGPVGEVLQKDAKSKIDAAKSKTVAMRKGFNNTKLASVHGSAGQLTLSEIQSLMPKSYINPDIKDLPAPDRSVAGGGRHPASVIAKFDAIKGKWPVKLVHGNHGFSVIATKNIKYLETIMEDPCSVADMRSFNQCYHCQKPETKVPCSNPICLVKYCSPLCKIVAEKTYHVPEICGNPVKDIKKFCSTGVSSSSNIPMLILKMLGMALAARKPNEKYISVRPADLPPFESLMRRHVNETELNGGNSCQNLHFWQQFFNIFAEDVNISTDPLLDLQWISDLYLSIMPNFVGVGEHSGEKLRDIGVGLLTIGTFVNHSCEPNAGYRYKRGTGKTISFLARRDIKKGEEVCINYVDTDAPYEDRRNALLRQYGFECDCAKCVRQGKMHQNKK